MRPGRSLPVGGALALGLLLVRVVASCVDLDSLGNGAPTDAGPSSEAGADASPDPCAHASAPAAPAVDDSPGEELPAFEIAVDKVTLDPDAVPGLDLDGVCTCDSRPGSFADGKPSCTSKVPTCDLDGGVDNAMAVLAKGTAVLEVAKKPNALIAAGRRTLVLQISKYNGRANDREVSVGAFLGEGIRTAGCDASVFDPAAGVWSPGRCGEDTWSISPASAVATPASPRPIAVGAGYVTDFRLAVRFGNTVLVPFGESTNFTVSGAVLTGRLAPLGADLQPREPGRAPTVAERRLFRLEDGILQGRMPPSDVLGALGSYVSLGTAVCTTSAFDAIKTSICDSLDIRLVVPSSAVTTEACDALSGSVGVVGLPARVGELTDASLPPNPCDASILVCPP